MSVMRQVTLIRHAQAHRALEDQSDFSRTLDAHGLAEIQLMAVHLRDQGLAPFHLLHSSAQRTSQTAQVLALTLGLTAGQVSAHEELYLADAQTLLHALQRTPDAIHHVALVGHNPGLSVLASRLDAQTDRDELPTAGVCALQFSLANWSELAFRQGRCVLSLTPASLSVQS